jgi:molybdate transport system ATP-binding protein
MADGPVLAVEAHHHLGTFALDVSFRIESWPALLFGSSGAGKTTLLRILAGLEKPDNARIALGSCVLVDTQQRIRQKPGAGGVQLVTQRPALFPHLTVLENVRFGVSSRDLADGHAEQLLKLLHADQLMARRPQHLSGGERQRVALARALACRPGLLLLDEAFTGMDGELKQEILSDLTELLAQQRVAALHVTHEVSDAFALNTEVIQISNGKLVAQGAAHQVLASERERMLALLR